MVAKVGGLATPLFFFSIFFLILLIFKDLKKKLYSSTCQLQRLTRGELLVFGRKI